MVREHPARTKFLDGCLNRTHHVQVGHGIELNVFEFVLKRIRDSYDLLRLTSNLAKATQARPGVARISGAAQNGSKHAVPLVGQPSQGCAAAEEFIIRMSNYYQHIHWSLPQYAKFNPAESDGSERRPLPHGFGWTALNRLPLPSFSQREE